MASLDFFVLFGDFFVDPNGPCDKKITLKKHHIAFVGIFLGITFFSTHLLAFPSQITKLTPCSCVVKSTCQYLGKVMKEMGESAVKHDIFALKKRKDKRPVLLNPSEAVYL